MDIAESIVRWLLWIIVHLILKVTDYVYKIISLFFGLQLSDFDWIWDIYWVLVAGLGIFITARLVMMLVRSMIDTDGVNHLPGINLITRLMMIGLITTLLPIAMPMMSNAVSAASTAILREEVLPSDIIIDAGLANLSGDLGQSNSITVEEGKHAVDVITLKNINDKVNDKYVYFENTENLFLSMILGGGLIYCFIMVAIQIMQRMMGLLMKIVLAPYAVSGLVDPKDNSTSLWFRLCIADFTTAYFQMMLIWISMLVATRLPDAFGGVTKGIAFIGAIFSVLVAPSGIAQMLGNDVGAQSGMMMMQHAQTMSGVARVAGGLLSGGVHFGANLLGSAVGTGTALGIYGIGRKMGARTLNPMSFVNGFTGTSSGGDGIGGGVSESSGSYTAGGEMLNKENTNSNIMQNAAGERAVAGRDGIMHYTDGRVNPNYSKGSQSLMGAMVGNYGARLYQNAARKLFADPQQRQQMGNRTFASKVSEGISSYQRTYTNFRSQQSNSTNIDMNKTVSTDEYKNMY